ncbi:hypothetical protein ACLKA7_003447 [Drosophila subpalustris]
MTSVIYVNSSSDSEEEGPPEAKRARREQAKPPTSKAAPSKLFSLPKASITQLPGGVKPASAGARTITGAYRSMNIPSGITVTKHSNSNGNINIVNPKPSLENNKNNNNNNNGNANNNSLKGKPIKLMTTVWPKASTTLATITSVPSPVPVKLTSAPILWPISTTQQQQQTQPKTTAAQKPLTLMQQKSTQQQQQKLPQPKQKMPQLQQQPQQPQQQKSQMPQLQLQQQQKLQTPSSQQKALLLQQQQQKPPTLTQIKSQFQQKPPTTVQLLMAQKLTVKQKQQLQQRLPMLQNQSLTVTPTTTTTTITAAQQKPIQLHVTPQKLPPPAHSATTLSLQKQKPQQAALAPPPPAHLSVAKTTLTPPLLAKLTPMPVLSKSSININNSAARTLPYKTKSVTTTATTTTATTTMRNGQQVANSSGITSATPIQSMTAGATPPLRLLATPPHCAAALNEPLLLNLPPTTSITPQLTPTTTPPPPATTATTLKMSFPGASISPVNKTVAKRVQPITVLKKSDEEWRKHIAQQQPQQQKPKEQETPTPTIVLVESPPTTPPTEKMDNEPAKRKTPPGAGETVVAVSATATASPVRAPLVNEFSALLQLCRETEKSKDMELLESKMKKYYYSVHENFVRSRGFRKQLEQTMERIRNDPLIIYTHLKYVVDELKARRKGKPMQLLQEETPQEKSQASVNVADTKATEIAPPTATSPSTGNKRTDERIRKLNRTLYTITKRISALEEADVDWNDDDDSSYLQVERYKKRACQIYEKICDLTGESKSAHRQMKQPILFKDSPYPQFNRTLSAFVNRMHEFPDYHDVLQLLEHCNKDKNLGLATFEMKRIAHDAFVKVGRLLQARRKTDLYETVTHFTANAKDPAASDAALLAKLNENNKKQTKISDILEKFAREQDLTTEEQREARLKEKQLQAAKAAEEVANDGVIAGDDDEKPCTSAQAAQAAQSPQIVLTNGIKKHAESENESDSEEDDDDDDESDEDVDTFVDNFKANGDLSEAESETELNAAPKTLDADAPVIVNNVVRAKTTAPIDAIVIDDKVDNVVAAQAPLNGKLKDAPAAQMLKIMSVSSLNASVSTDNSSNRNKNSNNGQEQPQQKQQQKKKQEKNFIDTEIVISDEES